MTGPAAWPFLVGRSRTLGHRLLVVPRFIQERRAGWLLLDAAGGDASAPGTALYREVRGSPVGDLTLVFRVVPMRGTDVGLPGLETLRDEHGRLIEVVEGLVLQGRTTDVRVSGADLDRVHREVARTYRQFWHSDEREFEASPAGPLSVALGEGTVPLRLQPRAPLVLQPVVDASATGRAPAEPHPSPAPAGRGRSRRSRRVVLAAVGLALAAPVAAAVIVFRGTPSTPRATTPSTTTTSSTTTSTTTTIVSASP